MPSFFSPELLAGFRRAQRTGYACTQEVARTLTVGCTEKEAAAALGDWLRARGITHSLHRPFAWFGERARFEGFRRFTDFLPSDRRLQTGDVMILDVSPVVEGYVGDVGYTTSLHALPELDRAREFLLGLRRRIPSLVDQAKSMGEVWREVDRDLRAAGYENCYARYPFAVLGHRVHRWRGPRLPDATLPISLMSWFGAGSQLRFLTHGVFPDLLRRSSRGKRPGFWAIEPHLGGPGFGAKFEEILVLEPQGRAYWLEEETPNFHLPISEGPVIGRSHSVEGA